MNKQKKVIEYKKVIEKYGDEKKTYYDVVFNFTDEFSSCCGSETRKDAEKHFKKQLKLFTFSIFKDYAIITYKEVEN